MFRNIPLPIDSLSPQQLILRKAFNLDINGGPVVRLAVNRVYDWLICSTHR